MDKKHEQAHYRRRNANGEQTQEHIKTSADTKLDQGTTMTEFLLPWQKKKRSVMQCWWEYPETE